MFKIVTLYRKCLLLPLLLMLSGCDMVLLNPAGLVARQQSSLLVASVVIMLLIVIPVIGMSLWFAWRYRESNTEATYDPEWDHSAKVELYVWAAPLLIIIALGAITWVNTHLLDPYRPLAHIDGERSAEGVAPIRIQAVALEWKWLFIYPELGIATVNEVAAPVDVPIKFEITSPNLMNSLFIPSLAGMVYAMPGMETNIHAVINETGSYDGVSGNYSGEGYSDMRFQFKGLTADDFQQWVGEAKTAAMPLDLATYDKLAEHSIKNKVQRFATVETGLYQKILNLCTDPEKMCIREMMAIDEQIAGGQVCTTWPPVGSESYF